MKNVTLSHGELYFRDEGQGTPILFVHGFPLDHSMWNAQIDALSSSYRCLAVDLRGFGKSTVTSGTVTMEQMADDLTALLDGLNITQPVILCGLSMGGYVAWQFWKRHSSRLAALILCDTRAIADTEEGAKQRLETADRVEAEGADFLAEAMLPKLYAERTHQSQPSLIEETRRVILATSPSGIAAAARGMAQRPDVTSWLPKIDIPALLITGEQDAISPVAEMKTMAQAMPKGTHVIIPAAGHMAPQEQPELVNNAFETFLSNSLA